MIKQIAKNTIIIMIMLFSIGIESGHVFAGEEVSINKTSVNLYVSGTYTLKIKGEENVKWSTKDKTIATVTTSGKVTAKKPGTTVVTAKVKDKEFLCNIKVKKFTDSEAVKLVKNYIRTHESGYMPRFIVVDHIEDIYYVVQAYDINTCEDCEEDISESVTYNWYYVNRKTGNIKLLF